MALTPGTDTGQQYRPVRYEHIAADAATWDADQPYSAVAARAAATASSQVGAAKRTTAGTSCTSARRVAQGGTAVDFQACGAAAVTTGGSLTCRNHLF